MNNLSLIRYEMKEINNIVNFLDNENNELDAETINDTKESVVCLLEEKSGQLELILKEQDMKADKCKEIAKYYSEKARLAEKRKETLKEMIKEAMKGLNVKRIETETGSFTIRNNTPSVIVDDKEIIPAKYKTIVQNEKIEKNEIKKAIKNGEEVAGVHLESSESLLVK